MASPVVIASLAAKLFDIYKSHSSPLVPINKDTLLEKGALKKALGEFDAERLFDGILDNVSKVTDEVVVDIIGKIRDVQKVTRFLDADGVLGENTLGWFENKPVACSRPNPGDRPPSKTDATPSKTGLNAIRYFIRDPFPTVSDRSPAQVERLFIESIDCWQRNCNFVAQEAGSADDANILVFVEKLNLGSNVLGVGDIGPPNKIQLRLRFEKFHLWTGELFLYTASHEFGHCLGVVHEDVTKLGQLMNPLVNQGIHAPQDQDIAAAQRIWGVKPAA